MRVQYFKQYIYFGFGIIFLHLILGASISVNGKVENNTNISVSKNKVMLAAFHTFDNDLQIKKIHGNCLIREEYQAFDILENNKTKKVFYVKTLGDGCCEISLNGLVTRIWHDSCVAFVPDSKLIYIFEGDIILRKKIDQSHFNILAKSHVIRVEAGTYTLRVSKTKCQIQTLENQAKILEAEK